MLELARHVAFSCGHESWRLCAEGKSLKGRDDIHCDKCDCRRTVLEEGPLEAASAIHNEA